MHNVLRCGRLARHGKAIEIDIQGPDFEYCPPRQHVRCRQNIDNIYIKRSLASQGSHLVLSRLASAAPLDPRVYMGRECYPNTDRPRVLSFLLSKSRSSCARFSAHASLSSSKHVRKSGRSRRTEGNKRKESAWFDIAIPRRRQNLNHHTSSMPYLSPVTSNRLRCIWPQSQT